MGDRTALEALWRERLDRAKLRLESASAYVKEFERHLPSGELTAPDDRLAQAVRAATSASLEYERILRLFTDLVLRDIEPDEPDWREHDVPPMDKG